MKEEPNFSLLSLNKDTKKTFENMLSNRHFLSKCFVNYQGPAGLYELGPNGTKLRQNLIKHWKQTLTSPDKEDPLNTIEFFEIESSILLPFSVLKNSGHVDKFDDTLIYDLITGDAFRADHYLLDQNIPIHIKENLEFLSLIEINSILKKYNILSPLGNIMGNACKFNLMFSSKIGAKQEVIINSINKKTINNTDSIVYLRPETAQNQFLYLPKLLQQCTLPFATFSVGKAFRNEISPKNQLLRLREFEQAEIEYFCKDSNHISMEIPNLNMVLTFVYYEKIGQDYKQIIYKNTISAAYKEKIICSKVIAYFLAKSVIFLHKLGIQNFRLRQHRPDEMAHYASDCWDIEIWSPLVNAYIECIGIADRGSFDLKCHEKYDMFTVYETLKEEDFTKKYEVKAKYNKDNVFARTECCIQKALSESEIIKIQKEVLKLFDETIKIQIVKLQTELLNKPNSESKTKNIKKDVKFIYNQKTLQIPTEFIIKEKLVTTKIYLPKVIEPSFGLSRIFQMLIETSFKKRGAEKINCTHNIKMQKICQKMEEEEKYYLSLPVSLAPIKVCISFLKHMFYKNPVFVEILREVYTNLVMYEPKIIKRSVNIGRKYISADEQGVCVFVTIDDETLCNKMVTVRCRECMGQTYVNISDIKEGVSRVLDMIAR
ncbi:Glycine--tRNA ligase [Cucumispora dikerogammari]|nr:Glycine--tRNA ligase [Cucumispora dikerogammari]